MFTYCLYHSLMWIVELYLVSPPPSDDAYALLGLPFAVSWDHQAHPLSLLAAWRVNTALIQCDFTQGVWLWFLVTQGCFEMLYVSTFNSSRALCPREGVLGLWEWNWRIMVGYFNCINIRQARGFWDWHGNARVCWRDRNIYKSDKQVCMGLQVH